MAASQPVITRLDAGKRLSEATIHHHSKTVYLAGQVRSLSSTLVCLQICLSDLHVTVLFLLQVPEDTTADIKGQTASCLKCVDDLLARAGTDKNHILVSTHQCSAPV
jgi:enamine deaminase RidA (YjgF/YER057c/UK114 family)